MGQEAINVPCCNVDDSGQPYLLGGPRCLLCRKDITLTRSTSCILGTDCTARCGGFICEGEGLTIVPVALPGTKMALKFVNKSKTKLKNFLREVSITNSLSSSPFIIKVFDVVFETEECYVFAQEYAPAGDLFDIIPPQVIQLVLERGEMGFGAARV